MPLYYSLPFITLLSIFTAQGALVC